MVREIDRYQPPADKDHIVFDEDLSGFGLRYRSELRDSSYVEIKRYLDDYAKSLHGLPATAVDRKTIADLLDTIAKKGPTTANRARTSLSALFSWAMRKGLHDSNPVFGAETRTEKSRHRALTDSELAAVWNTLPESDYGEIIRLLILTGQRQTEIGGLRWDEIDFDEELISLPPERTKNSRPHQIPMSAPVRPRLRSISTGTIGFGLLPNPRSTV